MIQMNAASLTNATTKAIAAHCKVRVLAWKRYAVSSGPGKAEYTVEFKLMHDGWYGICHCRAASFYHSCYHIAASFPVLMAHARQRDEQARKRTVEYLGHQPAIYADGRTCCRTWAERGFANCALSRAASDYRNERVRAMAA